MAVIKAGPGACFTDKYPSAHYAINNSKFYLADYDYDDVKNMFYAFKPNQSDVVALGQNIREAKGRIYLYYGQNANGESRRFYFNVLSSVIDVDTVAYDSIPAMEQMGSYVHVNAGSWHDFVMSPIAIEAPTLLNLLAYGACIKLYRWYGEGAGAPSFSTHLDASYCPYIEVIGLLDPICYATDITPQGGYVNPRAANTFSWSYFSDEYNVGNFVQTGSKFRYREVGAGNYTEVNISGAANTYTLPANTLTTGKTYEFSVAVVNVHGTFADGTWVQISTVDGTPSAVPVYPVNTYVEIDRAIEFSWLHNIDTGAPTTKSDLQYSITGGAWASLVTVTGSATKVTIPANTFSAGNLRWRVRTYNLDNVVSAWSEPAAYIAIGAPPTPYIVGVSNTARPTVTWQATGQIAYRLRLLQDGATVYDTGEAVGTGRTHMIKLFLANGGYIVEVRVKNFAQIWSDWAVLSFATDVVPPPTPMISASTVTNGAHLIIDAGEAVVKAYLLRNGVPIADISGLAEYTDYAALGNTQYVVRIIDASGNYADSLPVVVDVAVVCAVTAAVDDLSNVVRMNQKAAGQPAVTRAKQLPGAAQYYAGREYPVYTFSGNIDEQYSPSYYYTSLREWQALEALISRRKTVLYRDRLGNRFYGVIAGVTHTQENDMIIFALSLRRVDYVEAIDYVEV